MNYYAFHIGDYRSSTMHLSNEEDLAYRRLIDWYYDTEMPIPLETQWVAKRLRLDSKVLNDVLNDFFSCEDDGWHHSRCDQEIADYQRQREKNRQNGAKGGRKPKPQQRTGNPVGFDSVASGNPLETQGKGNQEPLTINQEPLTNNQIDSVAKATGNKSPSRGATPSRPDEVSESLWADFLAIRKAKRAPLTTTALEGIKREAEKAGLHLVDAIAYCCEAGWQGFKADWYMGREGGGINAPAGLRTRLNKQEALEQANGEVAKAWVAEMQKKMGIGANDESR